MNTYMKVYLILLLLYVIVGETAVYISIHRISIDPFLRVNGVVFLVAGGLFLFIGGIVGLVELFWD